MRFLPLILFFFGSMAPVYAETWDTLIRKIHPQAKLPDAATDEEQETMFFLQQNKKYDRFFEQLSEAFPDNYELWPLAFSDRDKDGVLDWVILETEGRLIPGDPDLDNDGIANALDLDPFDEAVTYTDEDQDGIPDHIDWDPKTPLGTAAWTSEFWSNFVGSTAQYAKGFLQEQLFKTCGVLMLFRPNELRTEQVFDIVKMIKLIFPDGSPKGLRYLSVAPARKDGSTNWVGGYSSKENMIVMRGDLPLSEREGHFTYILTHEIGHVVASTIDPAEMNEFNKRFWKDGYYTGGTSAPQPLVYWLDTFAHERSTFEWSDLNISRRYNIVSAASLKSPSEYFAESFVAYVYGVQTEIEARNEIAKHEKKCPPAFSYFIRGCPQDAARDLRDKAIKRTIAMTGVYIPHLHASAIKLFETALRLRARSRL